MSLIKAIEHGKEYRKKYRYNKAVDPYCRNHGGCSYCEENRLYSSLKKGLIKKKRNFRKKVNKSSYSNLMD